MDRPKTTSPSQLPPDEILESLPTTYARALRLHSDGADEDEISARLGVAREVVAALLELARRKAERAMADRQDGAQR